MVYKYLYSSKYFSWWIMITMSTSALPIDKTIFTLINEAILAVWSFTFCI